ncbi:hypothetical protein LCGC14_3065070 [marine sediment metagenome]|uniref:Uncharacterized protein n=1 Tax=marine sediment metagenome TaxID=412755 RepID=A0A0F8WIE7_9ZZZZ
MTAKCGCCNAPLDDDATCPEQHNRLHVKLKQAQEELSAWHQEFTVTVNGKPYPLDPIEAGKMVQDAEAEARMATQDKEAAQEERDGLRGDLVNVELAVACQARAILKCIDERDAAIERVEAAERDAAKQGARLAEHHRDSTGMWKCCPVCSADLTPAEAQEEGD